MTSSTPTERCSSTWERRWRAADLKDCEVAVILDLSSWGQLGEMAAVIRDFKGPRLVIDHHVSQDDLGAVFLKDTGAEATGALIAAAIRALGGVFTREIATALITAIAMDTGWFRHSSTRPQTLRSVAELVEAGGDLNAIYRTLFERNTLGRLRLTGEMLTNLRTEEAGRIAYATVTRAGIERAGAIPPDTEDLIDYTVTLSGVEVGLLFIELAKGGIKLSIRSRGDLDCPAWRASSAAAATAPPRAPPCPSRWPRASRGCSTSSAAASRDTNGARPDEPPRFPPLWDGRPERLGESGTRYPRCRLLARSAPQEVATRRLPGAYAAGRADAGCAAVVLDHRGTPGRLDQVPREPVGSVWLIRQPPGTTPEVIAVTAECPHLGCAIGPSADGKSFLCPCHTSNFNLKGKPKNTIPPRPMDALEVELSTDPDPEVRVKFQRFRAQEKEKTPLV